MKLFEAGSLWSYKGYRLFWFSTTIFVLGASAFPIALAVTILDAGGSATTLGLILGARILASVVFAPIAGVIRSNCWGLGRSIASQTSDDNGRSL